MALRIVGALALRPTGNSQGEYNFFSLNIRCHTNCNYWMEVSMLEETISCVHQLAQHESLGIVIQDWGGSYVLYDPPPEQYDNSNNDDPAFVPDDCSMSSDEEDIFLMARNTSEVVWTILT
eukprot:8911891-Ditylum_brightwellii.AAC.1